MTLTLFNVETQPHHSRHFGQFSENLQKRFLQCKFFKRLDLFKCSFRSYSLQLGMYHAFLSFSSLILAEFSCFYNFVHEGNNCEIDTMANNKASRVLEIRNYALCRYVDSLKTFLHSLWDELKIYGQITVIFSVKISKKNDN